MIFEQIARRKREILWWEFCGLMHDIGKLSDKFLWYRQHWHRMKKGWDEKDPHDHGWLKKHEILNREFPELLQFFKTELWPAGSPPCATLTVENAVHNHIEASKDELLRYLQQGDRTDAKYDRNNPLFGCEQTNHSDPLKVGEIYRSNVFGYEGPQTRVVPGVFEVANFDDDPGKPKTEGTLNHARRCLYTELTDLLRPYFGSPGEMNKGVYYGLRKHLKRYFAPALSDTTRPNNDTDLWDHVYSVASVAKAVHIGSILGQSFDDDHLFRLWGFGFDALRYLANSHKIGDLLGRRTVLQRIFEEAKTFLEFEIPFGNCVYEDDNCLFFMTPPLSDACFAEADRELRRRIVEISVKESSAEIVPRVTYGEPVADLTQIVGQIEKLRRKLNIPVAEGARELVSAMQEHWANGASRSASICAVCRVRPAEKQEENKLLCKTCRERREGHTKGFVIGEGCGETPLLEEIADQNGRVAMIVAKFGLQHWLNGDMIETMFITQPDAIRRTIEALPYVKELAGDYQRLKAWVEKCGQYDYAHMLEDIQACLDEKHTEYPAAFLYGRGIVGEPPKLNQDTARARGDWKNSFKTDKLDPVQLLARVCAKTPTPSTILDVWETTQDFFRGITEEREAFNQDDPSKVFRELPPLLHGVAKLGPKPRHYIEAEAMPREPLGEHETMQARVNGREFEVLYEGGESKRFWLVTEEALKSWKSQAFEIRRDEGEWRPCGRIVKADLKERAYYPYRRIIASPDLLLLLVPARSAVAVTDAIYAAYQRQFGKVYGRLPLSIGHIFFQKYMPMFSVLDAARRMESNFRALHEEKPQAMTLPVSTDELNLKLGNGEEDWYHPYIETEAEQTDSPSYFRTPKGPLVRISELQSKAKIRPNWYDSIFLGASAHRFDLHLEDRKDRFANVLIPVEKLLRIETQASVAQIWTAIKDSKIAASSLRNLEQMLLRRRDAWGQDKEGEDEWLALADTLLPRYFDNRTHRRIVREGIQNGSFFRALTLHLRIFKEKLNQEGETDGGSSNSEEGVLTANVSG